MRPILFRVLFGTFQPCYTAHSTTTCDSANATLPPSHATPPCPPPPSPLVVDSLPSHCSLCTSNPAANNTQIAYPSPADATRVCCLNSRHSNVTRCAPHHIFTLYIAVWVCHQQTSLPSSLFFCNLYVPHPLAVPHPYQIVSRLINILSIARRQALQPHTNGHDGPSFSFPTAS